MLAEKNSPVIGAATAEKIIKFLCEESVNFVKEDFVVLNSKEFKSLLNKYENIINIEKLPVTGPRLTCDFSFVISSNYSDLSEVVDLAGAGPLEQPTINTILLRSYEVKKGY